MVASDLPTSNGPGIHSCFIRSRLAA